MTFNWMVNVNVEFMQEVKTPTYISRLTKRLIEFKPKRTIVKKKLPARGATIPIDAEDEAFDFSDVEDEDFNPKQTELMEKLKEKCRGTGSQPSHHPELTRPMPARSNMIGLSMTI